MRRRPSRLVAVTAAVLALTGCEARVYGTPPPVDPDAPQLTVVAPQGPLAPLPEAPPDEPAVVLRRPGRPHQAGHRRSRRQGRRHHHRRAGPLDRPAGDQRQWQGHRDRVGRQAVHRRRPAAAQGPPLSPDDQKLFESMLRSSDDSAAEVFWDRRRRQRDRHPRRSAATASAAPGRRQRPVVQHHQHGRRPGALLRHDAVRCGRPAHGQGRHDRRQPGPIQLRPGSTE